MYWFEPRRQPSLYCQKQESHMRRVRQSRIQFLVRQARSYTPRPAPRVQICWRNRNPRKEEPAGPTEASSVTSSSRTYIGRESFSASEQISEAFLALRPPGSRIVAKTVCPLRARVSANILPKPVLEPVMRTTCLEFMMIPPCGAAVN